jgi:hypothetical protein
MSAQFRLVSAIMDDILYRADIQGMTDRHPTANILRMVNESVQQLRVRKANLGFDGFLTGTTPAALSLTAPVTGETYTEENWPLDAANIYGVHVQVETDLWLPLKPISLAGIRDYQRPQSNYGLVGRQGLPRAFALREAPIGITSTETVGKIVIVPKPTIARNFRIFYLKNAVDLASSDTFNGMAGDIEWIIWDVVAKISCRDNDSANTYQISIRERDRIEKVMAENVPRTQMGSSEEPRRADEDDYDNWYPRAL